MPNNMGQRWAPVAAPGRGPRRTGRDSDLEASWSRSQQTAGQRVPGRLLQVRVPIEYRLDPARRPKDWTAVIVPRRPVTSVQCVSGRLGSDQSEDRRRPEEMPNNTGQRWPHLGGRAGPWSWSRRTTGPRVPGRLLQVRVPPGFRLDPTRRPKGWTAVAVPQRLVTSGQWVSGWLDPDEGKARRRPGESPNITGQRWLHLGGWAGPWSRRRRTTGQRVPGRLLQARVPPGIKLDPARRPKDWTAVAVPRRLVTSGQWVWTPLKAKTKGDPESRLILRDSSGCTSEDGPGPGAGDGERRVRECRAVCSRRGSRPGSSWTLRVAQKTGRRWPCLEDW